MKAIVTISTIKGYANGAIKVGMEFDEFTKVLQKFEEGTVYSISWLVVPAKTVYKRAWGAPVGGEELFVLTTDYTEYNAKDGVSVEDWKTIVINHAKQMKTYFEQTTVRVEFIKDTETIILR